VKKVIKINDVSSIVHYYNKDKEWFLIKHLKHCLKCTEYTIIQLKGWCMIVRTEHT